MKEKKPIEESVENLEKRAGDVSQAIKQISKDEIIRYRDNYCNCQSRQMTHYLYSIPSL